MEQRIKHRDGFFVLQTQRTTYAFHVLPTGHLEHLYYGKKLQTHEESLDLNLREALREKVAFIQGNLIAYTEEQSKIGLENLKLEMSSHGKGDLREAFLEIEYADGSRTSDFIYDSYEILIEKPSYDGLPSASGTADDVITLLIRMKDVNSDVRLELLYHIYESVDVITRSARLVNASAEGVKIHRLMSNQLDFDHTDFYLSTFSGAWAREMNKTDRACTVGSHVYGSTAGISSNRMNPFFMLSEAHTTETHGECYAFNLIYSGNHYAAVEVNELDKLRVVQGIHPKGFCYHVPAQGSFQTPESVMTYSSEGHSALSLNMHDFIRTYIVRGVWQYKERPILLNSWEASYFNFNERKLLKLAEAASRAGIELFVMDDGWFGDREDDTKALGDWDVNLKKLPDGIEGLSKKIHKMGLKFGIWVEPEMISENSHCYRAHPDWAVRIPNKPHAQGRHQMILDLTREDVQNYVIEAMTKVFGSGEIDYVKWDMNRIFTDFYSATLPPDRQGEFSHRYMLGLYHVLQVLVDRFPHILFESCASGGNRFDLGMLCYMPQIWASDNTDAVSRMTIQEGYSYGYPLSVMGAHVSDCPNHQTLRRTSLSTRFNVAAFGVLGYECHLAEFSKEDFEKVKVQIETYKKWREVFQFGDFYRVGKGTQTDGYSWMVVSKDQSRAVVNTLQTLVKPNSAYLKLKLRGLDDQRMYKVYNLPEKIDIRIFGDLINMISPIHIKKDSLTHQMVAKFYKPDGEAEMHELSGNHLNRAGILLKQGFCGAGFDEQIRVYQDFASRLYFIE